MKNKLCWGLLAVLGWGWAAATVAAKAEGLDQERVDAVAAMLPEHTKGVGHPIGDRAAWEKVAPLEAYRAVVQQAEQINAQPVPDQPDDLFLDYSRTGNRTHWQRVAFERRKRVGVLVLAECVENRGRFVAKLQEYLDALCAERTWVYPAHDGRLRNFNQQAVEIDLGSSTLAWEVAEAGWILGDRLTPAVREKIRENVRRRVIDPYLAAARGQVKPIGWMTITNNWNAVCHAGVVGTALASVEDRRERAEIIVSAEKYTKNFLDGFTADGYCSEGLGYWNYGFGNYVVLCETIRRATGGKVDLFMLPAVAAPARFAARIQVMNGVAPAFADCGVYPKADADILWYVNRRLGLGLAGANQLQTEHLLGLYQFELVYRFDEPPAAAPKARWETPLRDWFDVAGILISRPAPGSACRMGVALKGGHNAEHHNHNDVGSYVVVAGDRCVILDPGGEEYTARTFSARRYESKLLNSFGHDVPRVAGQLQRTGAEARAKVVKTEFTDAADTLVLDITSAYAVPDLEKLERTFVYSRAGTGSLTVTDHAAFKTPQAFGTALITLGKWKRAGDDRLIVEDANQAVSVAIDSKGAKVDIASDEIHENAPVTPTRIGIDLAEPAKEVVITLTITPK